MNEASAAPNESSATPKTFSATKSWLKPGEKFRKLLMLLITWGLLSAFFIGYELYFVKGHVGFLQEREFRALAALSNELSSKFDQARISAQSSIKLVASEHLYPCGPGSDLPGQFQKQKNKQVCLRQYLDLYLKGVWNRNQEEPIRNKSLDAAANCIGVDPEHPPLKFAADGLTLSVSCLQNPEAGKTDALDQQRKKLIYTLDLTPWIHSAFQQLDTDFDDVLIADSKGRVVFQKSASGPRIVHLESLGTNGGDGEVKPKHSGLLEKVDNSPKVQPVPPDESNTEVPWFQKLIEATGLRTITPAGHSYRLFSQPAPPVEGIDSVPGKTWNLVVCGLRDSYRFSQQAHSLPYSTLIWAILIVVALFSLSWPLFKLRYMSNTERFSSKDGWYLILAILLASVSAMMMLLNASYISWTQDAVDTSLKKIAEQIKRNFKQEMELAFKQLQDLPLSAIYISKNPKQAILIPNYLEKLTPGTPCYPYFEMAIYVNRLGQQILKLDVRSAPTPAINVRNRSFFSNPISDENWDSKPISAAAE